MSSAPIRRYLRHGMLPQLAVFEASARLGSFTRAAEELHLAQPTVSTQMKKLTETIGLPLFEQIGKRMHLTPAGRALCEGTRELLGTLSRVDQSLASLRGPDAGRLRLAAGTGCEHFLPQVLAAFAEGHPAIGVSLEIHNRARLIERLAANADDLYVFANPPQIVYPVGKQVTPIAQAFMTLAREQVRRLS